MLGRLLRWSLVRRFIDVVRSEGVGSALKKVWYYFGVALGVGTTTRPNKTDGYLVATWQTLARSGGFHITQAPGGAGSPHRKIALIADMGLPQCRKYRVEQIAEFWRQHGVDCTFAHYQDVPRCVNALQDATHLMEYRLQTGPLTSMYRYEARRLRLPILYDIDDPLFSISAYETYENMKALDPALKAHFIAEAPKYLDMMNGADMLSMSTPGLADHARLYSARPVYVRRNYADSVTLTVGANAMQTVTKPDPLGGFTVAFASGSQGHEIDFAILQDQMVAFLQAAPGRRLMILGHFDKSLLAPGLADQITIHPFTDYDSYLEVLAQADCAVMPLSDDIFNRCKSAVRVLDAAAVGVPSLVGTISDMAHVVQHGTTGLVVDDPADWGAALEQMAQDPAQAQAMGQAARKDLETNWAGSPKGGGIIAPELLDWVRA